MNDLQYNRLGWQKDIHTMPLIDVLLNTQICGQTRADKRRLSTTNPSGHTGALKSDSGWLIFAVVSKSCSVIVSNQRIT